jgi:hypothetical protein
MEQGKLGELLPHVEKQLNSSRATRLFRFNLGQSLRKWDNDAIASYRFDRTSSDYCTATSVLAWPRCAGKLDEYCRQPQAIELEPDNAIVHCNSVDRFGKGVVR